ncbi:MAG: cell division ATP-binding protein FtsE [bacterium]|nr:cell division ATP-binding protein FtsE [bacterium]
MIKFHKVTKKFGTGKTALSNIDFEVEPKEFVFIVGPSGAGKTTLLRLLTKETVPTSGEIYVGNVKLSELPYSKIHELRRSIGFIFQDFRLLLDRTAAENVGMPLEVVGVAVGEIKKKVEKALKMVGLIDKQHHFPVQFSAGELQRLSLARAVIGDPAIIIADEPTGNLDPKTSWEIIDLLQKINEKGHTVIVATHDQDVVNNLKRRVITIKDGEIVKDVREGKYTL